MATGKGVIQGYTGVAAVDSAHQIIVEAQADGTGAEQELLLPVVDAIAPLLGPQSLLTADAGYHSEANLQALTARGVDALIADTGLRRRDERFATQDEHRDAPHPYRQRGADGEPAGVYQPGDFTYDADARTCICPAGKRLYRTGKDVVTKGYVADHFRGAKRDCGPCPLRARCLRTPARTPERTPTRQVAFFRGTAPDAPASHTARMKQRIDAPEGRLRYGQRFGAVEPVFGNLRANKRLDRFTLRGRAKVDGQWQLFCLVHNTEKLARHGYAVQPPGARRGSAAIAPPRPRPRRTPPRVALAISPRGQAPRLRGEA